MHFLASENETEIIALAKYITEAMKVGKKESRKQLTVLPVTEQIIVDYWMISAGSTLCVCVCVCVLSLIHI